MRREYKVWDKTRYRYIGTIEVDEPDNTEPMLDMKIEAWQEWVDQLEFLSYKTGIDEKIRRIKDEKSRDRLYWCIKKQRECVRCLDSQEDEIDSGYFLPSITPFIIVAVYIIMYFARVFKAMFIIPTLYSSFKEIIIYSFTGMFNMSDPLMLCIALGSLLLLVCGIVLYIVASKKEKKIRSSEFYVNTFNLLKKCEREVPELLKKFDIHPGYDIFENPPREILLEEQGKKST